jgi:hypothetical protein
LVAKAVAISKKSVKELLNLKILKNLQRNLLTARFNFLLSYEIIEAFRNTLESKVIGSIAGIKIKVLIDINLF